jgi:hypothetical protein
MTIHFLQPIRIHSSGSHVHELSKTSFLRDRWSSITTTNQNTSCWITEPPNLSDKLVIFKQDLDHTFITKNWIKPHLTLFITKTPSEGPQVDLEEFPLFSLAKIKAQTYNPDQSGSSSFFTALLFFACMWGPTSLTHWWPFPWGWTVQGTVSPCHQAAHL